MEQNLKGKTAIVTGSTSGIGLAIAKELLARGANVMFNGVFGADAKGQAQQAEFEATLAALRAAHLSQQIAFHPADVTNPAALAEMAQQAAAMETGHIDILVNNAGIHPPSVQKPFRDVKPEDFQRVMDINFGGVVKATQAVLPYLPAAGGGSIINISSVHGHVGSPDRTAYCSAKHAVEGLTKTLGAELALNGHQAVSIAPAFVKTDLALDALKVKAQAFSAAHPEVDYDTAFALAQEWRLQHQGGQWIEAEAIARLTADLAAQPDVTRSGQDYKLDNGYTGKAVNGVVTFPDFGAWAEEKLAAQGKKTPARLVSDIIPAPSRTAEAPAVGPAPRRS